MNSEDQIQRLVRIMARLRAPDGCPWDREQTPKTLKQYIVEEAYEVLDAIDEGDASTLCEELGDLLLQIVFQAQIADEAEDFDIQDVAKAISDKMERRHPHVFSDAPTPTSAADVEVSWEQIKAKEGKKALSGVPRALPALQRAARVTEKASRVGFDWKYGHEVLDKVEEEIQELREALAEGNTENIEAEMGDLLFSLSNFSRHIGVDAESALRSTIDRFTARFEWVEQALQEQNLTSENTSLAVLDDLWNEAKKALAPSSS